MTSHDLGQWISIAAVAVGILRAVPFAVSAVREYGAMEARLEMALERIDTLESK